jgi:hypothetical protein
MQLGIFSARDKDWPVNECNRDLDEAAGAADATACSTSGERELLTLK